MNLEEFGYTPCQNPEKRTIQVSVATLARLLVISNQAPPALADAMHILLAVDLTKNNPDLPAGAWVAAEAMEILTGRKSL
jgi:hypothetical protein